MLKQILLMALMTGDALAAPITWSEGNGWGESSLLQLSSDNFRLICDACPQGGALWSGFALQMESTEGSGTVTGNPGETMLREVNQLSSYGAPLTFGDGGAGCGNFGQTIYATPAGQMTAGGHACGSTDDENWSKQGKDRMAVEVQ